MASFSKFVSILLVISIYAFGATSILANPGDNRAIQGTAKMSSLWTSGWPASNCINGVTASSNNAQLCHTAGASASNEWWDLTLPENIPIEKIVIFNRTNCCSERAKNMWVLVSTTPFPQGARNATNLQNARNLPGKVFEQQLPNTTQNTYTVQVNNKAGRYVRIQKAGPGQNDSNYINLLEVQVIEGETIDLAITKTVSNETPAIGEVITFSLEVANAGPSEAQNVKVSDLVPSGFGNISAISDGGVLSSSNEINWTIASIPAGQTKVVTFKATVQ